jgi:hypothetical protein
LITTVEEKNECLSHKLINLEKELIELGNIRTSDQKLVEEKLNKFDTEKQKAVTKFKVKI